MKVAAVVPSLNPDKEFAGVISGLLNTGFTRIYVVNDGSGPEFLHYFDEAAAHPECVVLTHEVNQGKGRALKTAIDRFLQDDEGLVGLVTLDGDGQHGPQDVLHVAQALEANPQDMILGSRDFSQMDVPTKSALGNKITRGVFRHICKIPITDTQTGLRGIPAAFAKDLLAVKGERYEFETNMLLETKRSKVEIKEVPISTIYIDNNSASHFRPFQDGFRIYALILKFIFASLGRGIKFALSSLSSSIVDLAIFRLLEWALQALPEVLSIFLATAISRVCSALFNFALNKNVVFKSKLGTGNALLRYTVLWFCQMLCSYAGVYLLKQVVPLPTLAIKIFVDTALFFASFFIQRKWVFKTDS